MKQFIVITSIHEYTSSVYALADIEGWETVLVGDEGSPSLRPEKSITPLSLDDQRELDFKTPQLAPVRHYTRKNVGYLWAIKGGAERIYDTDDDNTPLEGASTFWNQLALEAGPNEYGLVSGEGRGSSINIYSYFTPADIWPRGLPLHCVKSMGAESTGTETIIVPVWQGLVNGDPDVDAIHRLINGVDPSFKFNDRKPAVLAPFTYTPFNSQNTLWHSSAFPYLYLPSTVSFRFTDILRGYVAQRCLWARGHHLGFTKATALQVRNVHDYQKDFEDEVPCYLNAQKTAETLLDAPLTGDPFADLVACYSKLSEVEIVQADELKLVEAWCEDLARVWTG